MTDTLPRPKAPAPPSGPAPLPAELGFDLPADRLSYRVKSKLLGPPLHTEQLEH